MKKNLIISPHIDDEVLGCYSALNQHTHVCYIGVEERSYASVKERIKELNKASNAKKFTWKLYENPVNRYEIDKLIPEIEDQINEFKPETVYIPHFSYNQDHQAVYRASLVALRPHDKNWFVKQVLVFEQPHTFLWPTEIFNPNFFRKIEIDEKIKTYLMYKSQVREHRSPEIIKSMGFLRGKQANVDYAEAFNCLRFVVE